MSHELPCKAVHYRKDEQEHEISCDECISTIPVPHLVQRTEPPPPPEILEAARAIRYKPIAIYGLLVKKEKCIDALYIYYRDRMFHRVGEPKNAGLIVNPPDHTLLIVETTCEIGDENGRAPTTPRSASTPTSPSRTSAPATTWWRRTCSAARPATPCSPSAFEPYLEKVQSWVKTVPNLQSVGRQGGFSYPNMHAAMRIGATCAMTVLKRIGE